MPAETLTKDDCKITKDWCKGANHLPGSCWLNQIDQMISIRLILLTSQNCWSGRSSPKLPKEPRILYRSRKIKMCLVQGWLQRASRRGKWLPLEGTIETLWTFGSFGVEEFSAVGVAPQPSLLLNFVRQILLLSKPAWANCDQMAPWCSPPFFLPSGGGEELERKITGWQTRISLSFYMH